MDALFSRIHKAMLGARPECLAITKVDRGAMPDAMPTPVFAQLGMRRTSRAPAATTRVDLLNQRIIQFPVVLSAHGGHQETHLA